MNLVSLFVHIALMADLGFMDNLEVMAAQMFLVLTDNLFISKMILSSDRHSDKAADMLYIFTLTARESLKRDAPANLIRQPTNSRNEVP